MMTHFGSVPGNLVEYVQNLLAGMLRRPIRGTSSPCELLAADRRQPGERAGTFCP